MLHVTKRSHLSRTTVEMKRERKRNRGIEGGMVELRGRGPMEGIQQDQ